MRTAHLAKRLTGIAAAMSVLLILGAPAASAHVDGEASSSHVLVELVRYAVLVALVLGATLGGFWLRARAIARRQP